MTCVITCLRTSYISVLQSKYFSPYYRLCDYCDTTRSPYDPYYDVSLRSFIISLSRVGVAVVK
jgi:hypothetical protein